MIPAAVPLAAAALAAPWRGPSLVSAPAPGPDGPYTVVDPPRAPSAWLVELTRPTTGAPAPAPLGVLAGLPLAAPRLPPAVVTVLPTLRVSDRGWIGEPDDAEAPNAAYPPRLIEPPVLERRLPLYPDEAAHAVLAAAELVLANGDGALDALEGEWGLGGRSVTLSRGPHRRPRHAPRSLFPRVAEMRLETAFSDAGGRLRVSLVGAGLDLSMAACPTYGGTGGADGHAGLAGEFVPRLLGMRRNIEPVLEDTAKLIYRLHPARIQAVVAVRDRGIALTAAGDVATRAALEAATVAGGTYLTCLAGGCLRLGGTATLLTVDARGDAAGTYAAAPGAIAARLLGSAGGLNPARIGAFAWPVGEAGLYLRGGTVAEALDALAAGVGAYWMADEFGVYGGSTILPPEQGPTAFSIEPWMLAGAPAETDDARPPWWRVRVGYRQNGKVQAGDELGAVTAADRDTYGRASLTLTLADASRLARYPLAVDPDPVESLFEEQADALALATRLDGLFGTARRAWTVPLGRWVPGAIVPGAVGTVRWPGLAALSGGRRVVALGASLRGDAATLTVWG